MALLGVVVQVLGRPVPCLPADDPTDGPPIRGVQVSGDPCGLSFGDLDEPPQEPTCGMLFPPRRMRYSFESRCRVVQAMLDGLSPGRAAAAHGASRAAGYRWLKRYREGPVRTSSV